VTAIRVDGKNLGAGAYLKDILIADLPEQGSRWLESPDVTLVQDRTGRRDLRISHVHTFVVVPQLTNPICRISDRRTQILKPSGQRLPFQRLQKLALASPRERRNEPN
jgi:hypothetical protein